jgi:hypothetical protein
VWQKESFFWVHSFSTGIQYKSYTASHFAHTQGDKQEQKKNKKEVLLYVLMIISSSTMVFFDDQNKCGPALCVEVWSL